MSAIAQPSVTGITAQAISASIIVSIGAITNSTRLAPVGMICLLHEHLQRVGEGLQQPQKPTTFGPLRSCIAPRTLRSATVR